MPPISEVRKTHKEAGTMHSLFAPVAFLNDTTVLTKSGDVFMTLRLAGMDPECVEEAGIVDVVQRFSAALRTLGPEYRVYQYLLKRHSPDLPAEATGDDLQCGRLAFLRARGRDLYGISLYLVVLRMRRTVETGTAGLMSRLSVRSELRVVGAGLRRQVDALTVAVNGIRVRLKDTLDPVLLGQAEVLAFLRSLVNCTRWKTEVVGPADEADVDRQ